MKLLIDFFPVVLFLIAYKFTNIYTATMVIIAASFVQITGYWLATSGLTLYLRDKRFIMWKPTIINWLFAAAFVVSAYIGGKPLIQRMLSGQLQLPDIAWKKLNWAWVGFFIVSGLVNLYFAQRYIVAQDALIAAAPDTSDEQLADLDCSTGFSAVALPLCETASAKEKTWVSVKVFGLMGLTILFIIGQTVFLMRYMEKDDENPSEAENQDSS